MQLPDLTITAAGSDREINLARLGSLAVIVCHGQNTAKAAMEVNTTVRGEYPDAAKVFIASLIDLRAFPSMFHGMVKPELEKAYNKAAGNLAPGADPADYVVLLPDWDGKAHDSLGIQDSPGTAAILVADADGKIVGTSQGDNLGAAALDLLAGL